MLNSVTIYLFIYLFIFGQRHITQGKKILQTKPTTKMQEAALVERLRYTQKMYIKCSVQRCEVGIVQAFQPHFITEKFTWSLGRV